MKHLTPTTTTSRPAPAISILVAQQKAAIVGTLATAAGALATAFNTYENALHTKGANQA